MKTKIIMILIFPIIVLMGCKGEVVDNNYDIGEITIEGIDKVKEGITKIVYSSMLETLYYCPGVNIIELNNKFIVKFIRCPIKETCDATNPVITGEGNEYILIEHGKNKIYIKSNDTLVELSQTKS